MVQGTITETHVSPDGKLTLLIVRDGADVLVGFEGSEWHTHGDLLVPEYGEDPWAAIQAFANAILEDRLIIRIDEAPQRLECLSYISIIDLDLKEEMKYDPLGSRIGYRYWSGNTP